ncbi:hypothetical protein ACLF6K_00265 [Streptomyces xanthophaeus]|uniref:hypothetical protein n=1 Tax=Streptomyces xanthophaeus TaxID=67385 RepID=UPI0039902C88
MKLIRRFAVVGAAAMAAVLIGAGSAQAQDDGGGLSLLGLPLIKIGKDGKGGNGGGGGGGVTGAQRIAGPSTTIAPGAFGSDGAICPEGQIATGGGFDSIEPGDAVPGGFRVTSSNPVTVIGSEEPTSWSVGGYNESQGEVFLRAWVVCVDAAE